MTIAEQLAHELHRLAPDWSWECQEKPRETPVLISPVRVKVSATSNDTGAKTIPIEVSCMNHTNFADTARFVCQILMIETPGGARAKALLVER